MNKQEKQFKKEYLEEKLHLIGDRLNDAYLKFLKVKPKRS